MTAVELYLRLALGLGVLLLPGWLLARALGVRAERARTVHEAASHLAQALEGGGPTLIDVALDRAFKPA